MYIGQDYVYRSKYIHICAYLHDCVNVSRYLSIIMCMIVYIGQDAYPCAYL